MPLLVHINGPPAIGKSTLAQMYADEHPGILNLDIDMLRSLIGGSRDRFAVTGERARPLALAMARTHLRAGYDVVMPQYLGRLGEIAMFEGAALDSGAEFREIVLMDTKERSLQRFTDRGLAAELPWHGEVRDLVGSSGGSTLLSEMYDRLADVLRSRAAATIVHSEPGAVDQTYDAVISALYRSGQTAT